MPQVFLFGGIFAFVSACEFALVGVHSVLAGQTSLRVTFNPSRCFRVLGILLYWISFTGKDLEMGQPTGNTSLCDFNTYRSSNARNGHW